MDAKHTQFLAKLILTLENNHNGCKQEVINMVKEELGLTIDHNLIREMINVITDEQVEEYLNRNNLV